jgi:sigma-B regulation protein RsbU (phosphoserine phosphatase)
MQDARTHTNESFMFLKNSPDFLFTILNSINSSILLLDKDLRIKAFNDSLRTMFSRYSHEDVIYMRCGEAIGCAYQIEEQKDCGKTSHCKDCPIRLAAIRAYMEEEEITNVRIVRPFFNKHKIKENKTLLFSTRVFFYKQEKYVIVILDDITGI